MGGGGYESVDPELIVLCCSCCCCNQSLYVGEDCMGCRGRLGVCCVNFEFCLGKGQPKLEPCICFKFSCEDVDGLTCVRAQCKQCCLVSTMSIPCNSKHVPCAVVVLGLGIYPKCGCYMTQKTMMDRGDGEATPAAPAPAPAAPAAEPASSS